MTPIQFAVTIIKVCGEDVFKEYVYEIEAQGRPVFGSEEYIERHERTKRCSDVLLYSFSWSDARRGGKYWADAHDDVERAEKETT